MCADNEAIVGQSHTFLVIGRHHYSMKSEVLESPEEYSAVMAAERKIRRKGSTTTVQR